MPLVRFSNNYPSFLDRFLENDWIDWNNRHFSDTNTTLPAVNIAESAEGFEVDMAAPGLEKNDFRIELDHGLLTISSEKKTENETRKGKQFTKREFSYQSFSRSFTLPENVDGDKISANYKDGILKVSIPKKEEARPKPAKTIEIK